MSTKPYEYALMCIMSSHRESAYLNALNPEDKRKHQSRERILREQGWLQLPTSEEFSGKSPHGYFGVAYYRTNQTGQTEVVVAHRGTCFNEFGNVLADIAITNKRLPEDILEEAGAYIVEITNHFRANNTLVTKFANTGFSLGGFIASACTILARSNIAHAVTFDAPGTHFMDYDREMLRGKIKNFVTRPNLVNTCNRHVGRIYQIPLFENPQPLQHKFRVNFNNLGMLPPTSLPHEHTTRQLRTWLKESDKHGQPTQSTMKAAIHLRDTLESHNLERIISYMETHNDKRLQNAYNVYRWPTAKNKLLFGEKHQHQFTRFDSDHFLVVLFDLFSRGLQLVKAFSAEIIWDMTKTRAANGAQLGVVGMKHAREDRIFYTRDEYQEHQRMIAEQTADNEYEEIPFAADATFQLR